VRNVSKAPTRAEVDAALRFYAGNSPPPCVPSMLDLALSASASLAASRDALPPRFNPRPRGMICDGSATCRGLTFLRAAPSWRTRAQIARATRLRHGALCSALALLERNGLIEHVGDPARHSRYYRYRATTAH
jgi:hypothetical protein